MEDLSSQPKPTIRARLRSMPRPAPEALAPASHAIRARLESLPEVRSARVVLGFLPLADEPDLTGLLEHVLRLGRRIALPAINWPSRAMWPVEVGDLVGDVQVTRHGVREPRGHLPPIPPGLVDVVLVPGLAFDEGRARLGRGGGFYDRFLASPDLRATKIGVAFDQQLVGRLPRDPHDIAMDIVVTDQRVIRP